MPGVYLPFRPPAVADLPRPGEPLLPALLVPLCGERNRAAAAALTPSTHADRRAARSLAYAIVEEIGERLPGAPPSLLDAPLPHPVEVLDRIPLERRTVRVLRRQVATQPRTGIWTVARYLAIPQFEGRALVDLLASLEAHPQTRPRPSAPREEAIPWRPIESELPTVARPPALTTAEQVMNLVRGRSPISESQVESELERLDGPGRIDVARILREAARNGERQPYRVMHLAGARIAIEGDRVTAARAAYSVASRCVHYWGAVTTTRVAEQLEATLSTLVEVTFLERLLSALPAFEWLERESGWFWLTVRSNRVRQSLLSVLAAHERVSLAGVAATLRKRPAGPDPLPPSVLGWMARSLPGVRVDGDTAMLVDRDRLAGAAESRQPAGPP